MSSRNRNLFRWFPPFAGALNIIVLIFAAVRGDARQQHWEVRFYLADAHTLNYVAALIGVFVLNTVVFVPLGERLGGLFLELPTLRAYSWDLIGSLCGTLGFGFFSLRFFSPAMGFAIVMAIYLVIQQGRARVWSAAWFVVALGVVIGSSKHGVIWSPYYYITVHAENPTLPAEPPANIRTMMDPPIYNVSVNQDFYQQHGTIDLSHYTPSGSQAAESVDNMLKKRIPVAIRFASQRPASSACGWRAGGGIDDAGGQRCWSGCPACGCGRD